MQKELERIDAEIKQWQRWKQECAELYIQGSGNSTNTKEELEEIK